MPENIIPFPKREANDRPSSRERITPQSLEGEQSVLGACMMEKAAIETVIDLLARDGSDFYRELHRKIWAVILALYDRKEPVDLITVTEELRRKGQLEEVGGPPYLTALIEACPSSANVESYVKPVLEASVLRQLLKAGEQTSGDVYNFGNKSLGEIVEAAEKRFLAIGRGQVVGVSSGMEELIASSRLRLMEAALNPESVHGVRTGFYDLDNMTGGLQKSALVIVAARPSMGKTSFAMQAGVYAAAREQKPVVVFSLEMSKEQLVQRMIASEAQVDSLQLRKGRVLDDDWPRIDQASEALASLPLHIVDTPGLNTSEMRAHVRRISTTHGEPCLIIADHLQKARTQRKTENRRLEIEEIAGDCKNMAREFLCPFVLLSQLSRAVEQREDKRPILSDLAESGAIEAEADVVAFLSRQAYYDRKEAGLTWGPVEDEIAEVIVGKHRDGPTGKVELFWHDRFTRFKNKAR